MDAHPQSGTTARTNRTTPRFNITTALISTVACRAGQGEAPGPGRQRPGRAESRSSGRAQAGLAARTSAMFSSSVSLAVMARSTTSSTAPAPALQRGGDRAGRLHGDGRVDRLHALAVEVGPVRGNARVAVRLLAQTARGGGAHGQPHVGIDGRRRTLGGRRALADQITGSPRVLGREPVEQHAVRDLAGEPAHLRTERGDDQPCLDLGAERGDAVTHAAQRVGVGAADAQQQAVQRQPGVAHALRDALRAARVQRDHADAECDGPGFPGRLSERGQSVGRARMVDPERAIPAGLGLSPTGPDDVGGRTGEQRKSQSHSLPPRVV